MIDPLSVNIPTSGVETSLPLLPESDVKLQIVESTIDVNKDQNGLNWNLKLATIDPATATDGRTVNPNYPLYLTLALQPREDSKDPEAYLRSLGETLDAVFSTDKADRPNFTAATAQAALGRVVVGSVYLDEYKGRVSNKIRRLHKAS